ncbi:homocysteine S-methyltransferase family protein, partial [Frankia sp. Cpl3]|nr:homocysteine S-methyltransferase family protein [Frankia sp. Cpl3]
MLRSFESTIVPEDLLLSAFPNAGRLGLTDGEYAYKSSPEYFGESALRLREQGIHLIGGCCGTTPEHIRAISTALAGLAPLERVNPELPAVDQPIVAVSEQLRHRPSIVEQVQHSHT